MVLFGVNIEQTFLLHLAANSAVKARTGPNTKTAVNYRFFGSYSLIMLILSRIYSSTAACAAAIRAIGTRKGEQDT